MELHTIYQDNNIKIEILKSFHDYLDDMKIHWIDLSENAKDFLYGQILKILNEKEKNWSIREKLTSSHVPIIEAGRPIQFLPPFDVFNEAVEMISYEIWGGEWNKEDLIENVASLSDSDYEIRLNFFNEILFKVHGFLSYYRNGSLMIILFNLKED